MDLIFFFNQGNRIPMQLSHSFCLLFFCFPEYILNMVNRNQSKAIYSTMYIFFSLLAIILQCSILNIFYFGSCHELLYTFQFEI